MDAFLAIGPEDKCLGLHEENALGSHSLLSSLLDELAYGVMVATLEGRVIHVNGAARAALSRSGLLETSGDMMRNATVENARVMNDGLARISRGKRSLVELCGERSQLTLALVPLVGSAGSQTAGLFFARETVHESMVLGMFARRHGLTMTEELVLGILCQGLSTPEIASQMKVAVSTIRSHVRSLCAKTRSSGARELVNRVAVLPPIASVNGRDQVH